MSVMTYWKRYGAVLFLLNLGSLLPLEIEVVTVGNMFSDGVMGRLQLVAPAVDLAMEEINAKYSGLFWFKQAFLYDMTSGSCTDLLASETFLLSEFYFRAKAEGRNLTALIYPGCYDERPQMAWLTKELNLLTVFGSVVAPTQLPHVIAAARTNYSPFARLVITFLVQFRFRNGYIIYDNSPAHAQFSQLALGSKAQTDNIKGFNIVVRPVECHENVSFVEALKDFRKRARVMVFFGNNDLLRKLLIEAASLDMTNGEYVYIAFDTGPDAERSIYGRLEWEVHDAEDEVARKAFRSLLVLSPLPTTANPSQMYNFSARLREISKDYNYRYSPNEKPNYVVKAMYDAYWMVAEVIHGILSSNKSAALQDGIALAREFYRRTFTSPIGSFYIDEKGERSDEIAVFSFDTMTSTFLATWKQNAATPAIVALRSIDWPNGKWPPPNTPVCGFTGLEGPCSQASSAVLIGGISGAVAVVLLLAFAAFGVRLLQRESRLKNCWWILDPANFRILTGRSVSVIGHEAVPAMKAHAAEFTPKFGAAIYLQRPVFLTRFQSDGTFLNSRLLHVFFDRLTEIQHVNINNLVGILCVPGEPLATYWYVDNFCPRLDLETVISEASRNMLDLDFRHGITRDILSGVQHVFTSPMKYCGFLRSTTCLIDSRFSVKLSKIGYDRLIKNSLNKPLKWPVNNLLSVAPEHRSEVSGSPAGDMFSLGTVLDMLFGDIGDTNRIKRRKKSVTSRIETFLSTISLCRDENPENRPQLVTLISQQKQAAHFVDGSFLDSVMRRMEVYAETLEGAVAQRTKQLLNEQKKCDVLLAEMLPPAIVITLRRGETVDPEIFEVISVLFSDIVGFSNMVASVKPVQVVTFLNDSHSLFDQVVGQFDAYKVETINDCYLVASGVPVRNGNDHALHLCKMGLKLLNAFAERFAKMAMSIKIGMHTGPCVAAIAGTKRPRYCLFGDTINTASRMESHGEPGKIHISQNTADYVGVMGDHTVVVRPRGQVQIKGKGLMQTYWVEEA